MKPFYHSLLSTASVMTALIATPLHAADWTSGMEQGTPAIKSSGPLAFGPEGILFAADTKGAAIYAIATGDTTPAIGAQDLKVEDVNGKIAALLGTSTNEIALNDITVNPLSHNVYVAVSRGRGPDSKPVVVRIKADAKPEVFSLDKVKFSHGDLPNPPLDNGSQGDRNPRTQSITDIAFLEDRVLIAGLSTEEFGSTFRAIPFPFKTIPNGTSVEIYHGSHGRFETRAPIRTFVPFNVGNEPELLAAYICTPLVEFPVSQLKPGEKVRGKTIAELGNMNRPIDMIVYKKDGKDFLLLANQARGIMKISTDNIETTESITERVANTKGLAYETIKDWSNVYHLASFDASHALVLRGTAGGADRLESLPLP